MKKALLINVDHFSSTGLRLEEQLRKNFAGIEFEVIFLKPVLMKDKFAMMKGLFWLGYYYWMDFLTGRKKITKPGRYFYFTPFIFNYFNSLIEKFLEHKKFDFIVQTQGLFDAGKFGIPNFIYTDHTILYNKFYPEISFGEYRVCQVWLKCEFEIYNHARLVMVMSENIRWSLINQYHIAAEKVPLVYIGNNSEITQANNPLKYSLKHILFVGKDWHRKGGPLLIKAFRRVRQRIPDATLTILGCSPKIKEVNVEVVGKVSLQKVADYYNQASVFCLPTIREPFGVVFIEAMLSYLPVITSNIGAIPELVSDGINGYKLSYNPSLYAERLIELLQDPEKCKKFGFASFEIANQRYRWDHVGRLIASAIKEALHIT
jgi:glycosyltransferase involved in cell wall biosynthesis